MTLSIFHARSNNPYDNLALEGALLRALQRDERILFLWQNARTVVIGRNQDAFAEYDASTLRAQGGLLARRMSGGGAVYHDLGNLNFSFLAPKALYCVETQMGVIVRALERFGAQAAVSGRNDILCDGRKVSGSAFFSTDGRSCHHGTLLVSTDLDTMVKVLRAPEYKLKSKGIPSVRARVENLETMSSGITIPALESALCAAFETIYSGHAVPFDQNRLESKWLEAERARLSSDDWLRGRPIKSTWSAECVLPFGGLRLELKVNGRIIEDCAAYSDAMDADAIARVAPALTGLTLSEDALQHALQGNEVVDAVLRWLMEQI